MRLTGSGLGCADWPACSSTKFIDVSSRHAAIEQVNRLFTGFVSVAVIAAVLGSLVRSPRRRRPHRAVARPRRRRSRPDRAGRHHRARRPAPGRRAGAHARCRWSSSPTRSCSSIARPNPTTGSSCVRSHRRSAGTPPASPRLTALALVTGTVVTGAGPHAGDEEARRYGVEIADAARVHGTIVVIAVVADAAFSPGACVGGRRSAPSWPNGSRRWIVVALLQGAIGYIQYFNEVPALLVGIHVLGATVLWAVTVGLVVQHRPGPPPRPGSEPRQGDRRDGRRRPAERLSASRNCALRCPPTHEDRAIRPVMNWGELQPMQRSRSRRGVAAMVLGAALVAIAQGTTSATTVPGTEPPGTEPAGTEPTGTAAGGGEVVQCGFAPSDTTTATSPGSPARRRYSELTPDFLRAHLRCRSSAPGLQLRRPRRTTS